MDGDILFNTWDAHDYTIEASYNNYLMNRIEQESRINLLLAESTILNESGVAMITKTNRIRVLYEAKLSENIKSKFMKFVEFIKNIFGKFMANMTKILLNEKKYLEKYRDVILNKPGSKDIDVSWYGDYNKGISRITEKGVIPVFNWSQHANLLKDNVSDREYIKLVCPDIDFDENDKLENVLKDYFIAKEAGQQQHTLADINFTDLFNYCYDFNKIKTVTSKDIKNIEDSAKSIQNAIEKDLKDDPTVKAESAFDIGLYNYLHEENEDQSSGSTNGASSTSNTADTNSTTRVSNAAKSFDGGKNDGEGLKVDDHRSDEDIKKASGDSNEQNKIVEAVITRYTKLSQAVVTAKWTAAEQIAKDYMKIINIHVKSHVGKTVDDKTTKDTATTYKNDADNDKKFDKSDNNN